MNTIMKTRGITYGWYRSPLGPIAYGHVDGLLCELKFLGSRTTPHNALFVSDRENEMATRHSGIETALSFYFEGDPSGVSDWPIVYGGTDFQTNVWKTLRQVPYGQTITYGELAALVGKPKAARAIGRTMGANPMPIFVPCHRVIAAGSRIGGFSSGLDVKRTLLVHEGALMRGEQLQFHVTRVDLGETYQT